MSKVPPVVPFAAGLAGVGLIIAAYKNVSPLQQLRAVLGGTGTASAISTPLVDVAPDNTFGATVAGPIGLVKIGQGEHELTAAADVAFQLWQGKFGATIWLSPGGSIRSFKAQADAHAKDPKRFATAEKSEHVQGTAVDVDLAKVGAVPPKGGRPGNATWTKLYTTAVASGWKNPRGPYNGDHAEAWHFSRNGG